MPSRNIIKSYIENGYYHVYNRGIDKRNIFIDEQDCKVFLYYISIYLSPKDDIQILLQQDKRILRFLSMNLSTQVDMLAFSLMPNHFHLLLKQHTNVGITKFMKRLITAYVMYFNSKYHRRGPLFESIYKACIIDQDSYLLHLSRYIHLNPINLSNEKLEFNKYSSYSYYLGMRNASWIKPHEVLRYFNASIDNYKINSYKSFVEDYAGDSSDILGSMTLEKE